MINKTKTLPIKVQSGFTLIELLLAIVIIGVLTTFSMVNILGVRMRSRDTQRKSDMIQLRTALELYRTDNGSYPPSLPTCGLQFRSGTTVYMQKIPCDPKTASEYTYTPLGSPATSYSLTTCLENLNDQQKDNPNIGCAGDTVSFTQNNP